MKNEQVIAGQIYEIGFYAGNTEKYLICVFDKSKYSNGYCCAVNMKTGGALNSGVDYCAADMQTVFGANWQDYRLMS